MSGLAVAIVVGVWLTIGLTLSLVLGRRGHDGFAWLVVGTLLGPLAVPLAFDAAQHEEPTTPIVSTAPGIPPERGVDLLVGADGSDEAHAALEEAVALFGERLGRVELVRVVPFDGGAAIEREASDAIGAEALRYADLRPGTQVLRGHPAEVLAARALTGGFDVLVVGTRGSGRHPFGSTARELATSCPIPVLLLDAARRRRNGTEARDRVEA